MYLPAVMSAGREISVGVGAIHQYPYSCDDLAMAGVDWVQDWSMDPLACPGIKPVCQCWKPPCLDAPRTPECDLVLGPNECSIAGQCNMTAEELATWWPQFELYAVLEDVEISTPCDSLGYIQSWKHAYETMYGRSPRYDRVCIHSYPYGDVQQAIAQFKAEVELARAWVGETPLIIHEVGYWPAWSSKEDVAVFIREIKPWLEEPVAWFALSHVGEYISPWHDTSLVENGQLTILGEAWVQ